MATLNNIACTSYPVRLNVGCGPVQPAGWINIDSSNRAKLATRFPLLNALLVWLKVLPPTEFNRFTRTWDVRQRLPLPSTSVTAIYSGEMLEHLTKEEGQRFLAECMRLLVPGGVLRIRVPDNYRFWRKYCDEYETTYRKNRHNWNDSHTRWIHMFFHDICQRRVWFGSMGHYHKWMYDEVSLIAAFESAGFTKVARRSLHDSRIADVACVETRDDLLIEGIAPWS